LRVSAGRWRANLNTANGTREAGRPDTVAAPVGSYDPRDPWLRVDPEGAITFPLAGQPGHGCTAVLRSQPTLIVDGLAEGGYTGTFEIICCECGDNPYLDYSQISPRLQQIRGPYEMAKGIAAYEQHLGLTA
jgi:hypothetical protein